MDGGPSAKSRELSRTFNPENESDSSRVPVLFLLHLFRRHRERERGIEKEMLRTLGNGQVLKGRRGGMRIVLAGKVDQEHGAWRDAILGTVYDYKASRERQRWVQVVDDEGYDWNGARHGLSRAAVVWPVSEKAVLGIHDYLGPYRREVTGMEDGDELSGVFHGIETGEGAHGQVTDDHAYQRIVAASQQAIRDADMVFAYLNSPDAYGTIAEIGYAAALGKFIAVLIDADVWFSYTDVDFVARMANVVRYRHADDRGQVGTAVVDALKDAFIAYTAWTPPASPIRSLTDVSAMGAMRAETAQSFAQIARWTSDPRVRNEAQRMVKRLGAG